MKKTRLVFTAALCALAVIFTACRRTADPVTGSVSSTESSGLWKDALYTEDSEIGEGVHNVLVEVTAEDKSVTLTLHSDKDNLADILTENKIAEGEDSEYGLYIKKVNGISADFDIDGAYWGLSKDGEMTLTGASGITINDGDHYELVYTPAS